MPVQLDRRVGLVYRGDTFSEPSNLAMMLLTRVSLGPWTPADEPTAVRCLSRVDENAWDISGRLPLYPRLLNIALACRLGGLIAKENVHLQKTRPLR